MPITPITMELTNPITQAGNAANLNALKGAAEELDSNKLEAATYTAADVKSKYEANADTNAFTDAEKTQLAGAAPLASPAFTGSPTAPTATPGNNTTLLATTAFVQAAITAGGGYTGWTISDGVNSENIASGDTLTFAGAGATTVGYNTTTNTFTITSTDTTYVSSDFNHDQLTGYVANEHIDWTVNDAATIDIGNIPDLSTLYLTGNETITLSGDATGSGTTVITVTVVDDSHVHTHATLPTDILVDTDLGVSVQAYDVDTAKTDVAQTFTVSQRGTVTADNDGSFDMNVTNKFKCTPTATFALTFTNLTAGQGGVVLLDNSGGYTITKDASVLADSAFLTTISTAGKYVIGYECDGTNVWVTGSQAVS